jgi:rhodanese-related sulfurtransferase
MKDSRVAIFRKTLDGLVESLDATVRVGRWAGTDDVPEPLRDSAGQLLVRLAAANRLAAGRFSGSKADEVRVKTIADAVRRLDVAYVAYCQSRTQSPDLAAVTLDAEIQEIRASV